jgi:hypothetical protein
MHTTRAHRVVRTRKLGLVEDRSILRDARKGALPVFSHTLPINRCDIPCDAVNAKRNVKRTPPPWQTFDT